MECSNSPNCVSSLASGPRHYIRPLVFDAAPEHAWAVLKAVLRAMPRLSFVREADDVLHAYETSRFFGFVDDLWFKLQARDRLIHVRSASRRGYYDFGVNRRRVERIRRAFLANLTANGYQSSG